MSGNRNTQSLLVEIVISVFFFALCSTVLLQTFAAARDLSARAQCEDEAMIAMQEFAARLNTADDAETVLKQCGYVQNGDEWVLACGSYKIRATITEEEMSAGRLISAELSAVRKGRVIATIPAVHYVPGEVGQ